MSSASIRASSSSPASVDRLARELDQLLERALALRHRHERPRPQRARAEARRPARSRAPCAVGRRPRTCARAPPRSGGARPGPDPAPRGRRPPAAPPRPHGRRAQPRHARPPRCRRPRRRRDRWRRRRGDARAPPTSVASLREALVNALTLRRRQHPVGRLGQQRVLEADRLALLVDDARGEGVVERAWVDRGGRRRDRRVAHRRQRSERLPRLGWQCAQAGPGERRRCRPAGRAERSRRPPRRPAGAPRGASSSA